MKNDENRKLEYCLWIALLIPLLWLAAALAQTVTTGHGLAHLMETLTLLMNHPLSVQWCSKTLPFMFTVLLIYPAAVAYYYADRADRYPGAEHGTAEWGNKKDIDRRYRDRENPEANLILSQNVQMATNVRKHYHNLNVALIGSSGTGKTTGIIYPNLMQCNSSNVILDPKGEILRTIGPLYEKRGIPVTVIDLVHFKGHYNPMAYLETDEDAIKLAHALVNNTKPKDAPSSGDKFWDDSATMLLSALILYLMYEAPKKEQNFSTIMQMVMNGQVEEDPNVSSPLDMLFEELEEKDPMHPAVLQYKSFRLGAAKTLQSILISVAANLYMFNSSKFAEMTSRDETFIPELGKQKRAIFLVIPDHDTTFNFLVTVFYEQLFDQLFRLADSDPKYEGRLPMHVQIIMDEFANVAVPQNFKNILSVCRSRSISILICLQSIAQLKSLFKDDWEGILSNCDSTIYLGGNEYSTYEFLSKNMGKTTERTVSQSVGRGGHGSSSVSFQTAGRDLQTPDEIRRIKRNKCLVLISNEGPIIDRKYKFKKHPNAKFTALLHEKPYVMPPDYLDGQGVITQEELKAMQPELVPADVLARYELIDLEGEENEEEFANAG